MESRKWIQTTILNSANAGSDPRYAAVGISGNIAIVGAAYNNPDQIYETQYAGSVFIFERNPINGTWNEISKLIPDTGTYSGHFGTFVGISGDTIVTCDGGYYDGNLENAYVYNISENEFSLRLTINYNYYSTISISGMNNSTSVNNINLDSCVNIFNEYTMIMTNMYGCYLVTLTDCDDSLFEDRTNNHGLYTISVGNDIAAFGGYYQESETNTICTDNERNDITFCIIPIFCSNNNNLWTSDNEKILFSSFKSVINSSLINTESNDENSFNIECSGDHSCINSFSG